MSEDYTKKRFLVVEDFDDMLRAIRQMLEAMGAKEVRLAANGEDAIKEMARFPMDAVLCDYNLGDSKDGQQILEEARARRLLKPAAVFIMVTAETSIDMVLGAVDHKPDDYIIKPFNRNALKLRLDRAMARKAEFAPIEAAAAAGDVRGAIARCDEGLAHKGRYGLEIMERKGGLLLEAGDHAGALALYDEVLAHRELHWAKLGRGICLFHMGDLEQAHDIFAELVSSNRLAMEAYDWLARVEKARGNTRQAQQVLAQATALSPKSVHRQKALGELAYGNADYELAGKAFRSVVRLNRYSSFRSLSDHTRLAEALHSAGDDSGALSALREGQRIHRVEANAEDARRAALLEGGVLKSMGREDEARAVLAAVEPAAGEPADARHSSLDDARRLFEEGKADAAAHLLEELVRNNHEDEALLAEVKSVFAEAGLRERGSAMVDATQDQLIRLNNEGVDLARAGKLGEAIALFRDAAEGMPANRVVNLNAAQVLVIEMRDKGVDQKLLAEAERYLERVAKVDPDNAKYRSVRERLEKLAAAAGGS
ncbi:MAG: response regulator [Gammaproteobacteria bacterium]|nr:response regulator [Gammaproteobacteria bacterium]